MAQVERLLVALKARRPLDVFGLALGRLEDRLLFDGEGRAHVAVLPTQQPVTQQRARRKATCARQVSIAQQTHFMPRADRLLHASVWVSQSNSTEYRAVQRKFQPPTASQKRLRI